MIRGVKIVDLKTHHDTRGSLTEVFRKLWTDNRDRPQINVSVSKKNVLRGVHAHAKQHDYIILISGRMLVGLRDLRKGSPTFDRSTQFFLNGENMEAMIIPPGVAHGFYFPKPSAYVNVMSECWGDGVDQIRCHFADPDLQINWPFKNPIISEKDAKNPPLKEILDLMPPWKGS